MTNPPSHLLELLASASLRASALILLLLALRPWLRRALGSPLVSLLWLVVLVRLVVPGSAELPRHPLAFSSQMARPLVMPGNPWKVRVSIEQGTGERKQSSVSPRERSPIPWEAVVAGIWAVGSMVALVFFATRCWRTGGFVRRAASVEEPRLRRLFLAIPETIRRRTDLRITEEIPVAALVGIWRPKILLPREWTEVLSDGELRHVLLHELGHARRWDLVTQWLFALAQCLHWFNPLVWLAARLARADAELACDAWVLAHSAEQERSDYGDTLFRTSQLFRGHGTMAPLAIGMAASRHALVVRVREAGLFRPVTRWQAVAGLFVALTLAGAWMTRPAFAQEPPVAPAQPPPVPATPPPVQPPVEAKPSTTPKPAAADPAHPEAAGPSTQVEIEANFFEMNEATAKELNLIGFVQFALPNAAAAPKSQVTTKQFSVNDPTPAGAPGMISLAGVFTPEEAAQLVQRLVGAKGVDLIEAPRVTTKSGQRAVMEIIREFRYATQYTLNKKSGKPMPTAFETRNIGVTLEAEPVIGPDGCTIDLNLVPQVVELEGFVGSDGKTIPLRGGRGVGADMTINDLAGVNDDKHGVLQPIFSTRKMTASVSIFAGSTVLLGGMKRELKEEGKAPVSRFLYVFISARFVNPRQPPMVSPPPTVAPIKTEAAQNSPDAKAQIPTALAGPNGYVHSPFAPDAGLIDVRGFASGTEIKCPYTGKTFKTP